jgi:hypothetical protein
MKARLIISVVVALALSIKSVYALDYCHVETRADDYGDHIYKVTLCCSADTGVCRVTRVH